MISGIDNPAQFMLVLFKDILAATRVSLFLGTQDYIIISGIDDHVQFMLVMFGIF